MNDRLEVSERRTFADPMAEPHQRYPEAADADSMIDASEPRAVPI